MYNYLKDDRIRWQYNWFISVVVALGSTVVYFLWFIKENLPEGEKIQSDIYVLWYVIVLSAFFICDFVFVTILDVIRAWLKDNQKNQPNNPGGKKKR